MPRPIWSGAISFGLVNVPVKLFTAVSRKTVHFNQIDSRSGSRIKYKKVSAADETEVPSEAIVKGYELTSGQYVLIDDAELSALDPEASRTIDIEAFVDLEQIDPIFYDAAYYVAPDKATTKPYALLERAMEETGKVAIARFVMRSKQYLCAVRPKDGTLIMSTMVYADEINAAKEIPELEAAAEVDVTDKEVAMARQLIDSLADDFRPEMFEDTYRNKVLEMIERRASGAEAVLEAPESEVADKVVDLMAALEASVKAAKEARGRHPSTGEEKPAKPAKAAGRKRKSA